MFAELWLAGEVGSEAVVRLLKARRGNDYHVFSRHDEKVHAIARKKVP